MDKRFEFSFVPDRTADRVQRSAVLYKLFRPPDDGLVDVPKNTQRLLSLWRQALTNLWGQGWQPQNRAATFARNCQPAFVDSRPRMRSCRLRHLCPFCYARWARDVWTTISTAVPTSSRGGGYTLVERRHEFKAPFLADPAFAELAAIAKPAYRDAGLPRTTDQAWYDPVAFQLHLEQVLAWLVRERYNWVQRIAPAGAFIYTVVEPWTTCWRVEHRQLFLLRPGQLFDPAIASTTRGKFEHHVRLDKDLLFHAVVRTCAYPDLLLRGDYDLTAIYLRARRRFRLSASFGSLRRSCTAPERDDVCRGTQSSI